VLRRLADAGLAVVLVEHDMALVMGVSDHVVVLDAGRPLSGSARAHHSGVGLAEMAIVELVSPITIANVTAHTRCGMGRVSRRDRKWCVLDTMRACSGGRGRRRGKKC